MTRVLDAGKTHASTTSLGTITHVAPEVLLSGKQTKAGDVYSYGMLSKWLNCFLAKVVLCFEKAFMGSCNQRIPGRSVVSSFSCCNVKHSVSLLFACGA
jgi:serine/threonine protein kinase